MPNESCWRNSAKEAGPSGRPPDRFCPASKSRLARRRLQQIVECHTFLVRRPQALIRQVIQLINDRRACPGIRYSTARGQERGPGGYRGTECLVVYQELRAPDPRSKVTPFYGHTPPTLVDLLGVS